MVKRIKEMKKALQKDENFQFENFDPL